jgi:lysophospholipase L1-like esterase
MPALSLSKKILFAAIATVLFFALFEIVLRLTGFHYDPAEKVEVGGQNARPDFQGLQRDPTMSWSWVPIPDSQRIISIPQLNRSFKITLNKNGFRGPDFADQKSPSSVRIVLMGDSCTLGWGVDDRNTYGFHLQRILRNRSHKSIQIVNAGVLGYTTFQGLHDLKTRILRLQPDIVILSYNWNDHLPALEVVTRVGSTRTRTHLPDKELPAGANIAEISENLRKLQVVQFVDYLISRFYGFGFPAAREKRESTNPSIMMTRVSVSDYKRNLQQMIELLRLKKIKIVMFTEAARKSPDAASNPVDAAVLPYFPLQANYNQAFKQVAQAMNVICVDPVTELSFYPPSEVFLDMVHKNSKGNLIIANQLVPAVLSLVESVESKTTTSP